MSEHAKLREDICMLGKSMFDRGLACGSTGNISARLSDGSILVTPTGRAMGFLDRAQISHLDAKSQHLSGDKSTKQVPLHTAFYHTRTNTGAVVHLHSTHSVALSMMPDIDPDNVLPTLTPYAIMQVGKVKLLPFFVPGDPAMGAAVRGLAGKRSAMLLASHGPVVAGKDLFAATFAMEELEETAKLAVLTRGLEPRGLTPDQVGAVVRKFDVDW
ncbi:3-oxo-tetronate 4-phosphate decarboxylase [Pseudooctadecabacter jejudonensis]|uniref:3-oxo-tetronate 4-phosphate decarboxylase n=1 Tax=Pseudooctadecabacter jejudonensis TaxID=1391910 RepID=A0A1Y5SG70_9RHOB|nr:aldolase [Pseudooctadecabacter jejudonensis]SLN38355.1 L-fuculose phosphate aldolase [Pseudooctadecabacter jejudonensis]